MPRQAVRDAKEEGRHKLLAKQSVSWRCCPCNARWVRLARMAKTVADLPDISAWSLQQKQHFFAEHGGRQHSEKDLVARLRQSVSKTSGKRSALALATSLRHATCLSLGEAE